MEIEKDFICEEVPKLSVEDRIRILSIVKNHDAGAIKRFPDGSRVNLDILPETIIQDIYDRIKYLLNLDVH